jgi:class 3 adenylate cyclase
MTQKKRQFQDVLRVVSSPGSVLYNDYLDGVNAIGHMDCPAPPWDTEVTYRLAAVSGSLVIQHLVEGSWETAPTEKPKEKANGVPGSVSTKTRTVLFMDVAGWSRLKAHEIHAYATKGLHTLSTMLIDHDFVNTWGDAIVATFDSAKCAAENALRIRDFFANSYPESGVASGLTCRVSLHVGEVISCDNALRNGKDIFGEAVHVAARLEPVTMPGNIFCTKQVADMLSEVHGSAPRAWPIGPLDLAKDFGRVEVYVVTGPNANDPRPLILQPVNESSTASHGEGDCLPDASASTRIKGWLNKLPTKRSGEAISLEEIEKECKLEPGQPCRLLPGLVPGGDGAWNIEELTPHDVILRYKSRTPQSRPRKSSWLSNY